MAGLADFLRYGGLAASGFNAYNDEAERLQKQRVDQALRRLPGRQAGVEALLGTGQNQAAAGLLPGIRQDFKSAYGVELPDAGVAGAPIYKTATERVPMQGPPMAPGGKLPDFTATTRPYDTGERDYSGAQTTAAIRGLAGLKPDAPKYEERDPFKEVGFFDKQGQWHTTSAAQKKPDPYHPGQIYEAGGHRWLRSPDGQTQDLGRVTYAPQAPQHPQFVTVGDQVGWAYPPAPGGAAPAQPFAPVGKRPPPTGAELAAERAAKKEQQQRVTAGGMVAAVVAKQFPWAGKATVDKTTGDVLLNIGAGSPASARELRRLETEGSGVYDVVKDPDGRTRLMITGTPDASWLRSQLRPDAAPKLVTDETNTRVEDKAGVKVAPKSGAASNRAKIFQWARAEAVRELRAGKRMGQVVTDAEIEAKSQQLFNHALETGFVPGGPEAGPGAGGDPAVRAILEEFKADRAARGKK